MARKTSVIFRTAAYNPRKKSMWEDVRTLRIVGRAVSTGSVPEFWGRIATRAPCAGTVRRKKARGTDSVEESDTQIAVD